MYRLYEFTKLNDKESQATYPYEIRTEAEGEYETKLGAYMKKDDVQAEFLMILDDVGAVIKSAFVGEDEISPRLIEIKYVGSEEQANTSKYDTEKDVHANFHTKLGAAMKDANVRGIMLRGIDGHGNSIEYTYWVRPVEENAVVDGE